MPRAAAFLEFDEPIDVLLSEIETLSLMPSTAERQRTLDGLRSQVTELRQEIYSRLTPWQRVLVARHPRRPRTRDHVSRLFSDFTELHGDRRFGDDPGVVAGFARFGEDAVLVVGHQRPGPTFAGGARPEGYRKALRCMKLAEKFNRPIITFVDSAGTSPDVGSEERGMADAIAYSLREMTVLAVPVIVVVTGESTGGGALALGMGDHILMLEYAVYGVVPVESGAQMLWGDAAHTPEASDALKITASDLVRLGVIDEVVPEPLGGAHADPLAATKRLAEPLRSTLDHLASTSSDTRVARRHAKIRRLGLAGIDGV